MARPIYSDRFYVAQGLQGPSGVITVPPDETWIVKQLSAYSNPLLGWVHVFFHDSESNATLWSIQFNPEQAGSFFFYGAFCFRAGQTMDFFVDVADPTDGADVYVGGYRLLGVIPE